MVEIHAVHTFARLRSRRANRAKNIKFARYESVCENDRRVVTFTYKFTSLPVAFANNNRARERRCTESRASLARIVFAAVELQSVESAKWNVY